MYPKIKNLSMMSVALVLSIGVWMSPSTVAQEADADAADAKVTALKWIDSYREAQVLFHKEDMDRLHKKLATATPEQAAGWLKETKDIRNALDSQEWQETRVWLKEFLKVQAIYTKEQIEHFREEAKEAAKKSPEKFKELLMDVENKRAKLISGAATSARLRQQKLAVAEAYRKEEAAARDAARIAAAKQAEVRSAPQSVQKRPERQRPPQLIDSLDVARWSVMRGFWPGW